MCIGKIQLFCQENHLDLCLVLSPSLFTCCNGSLVVLMKKPLLHNDGLKNVLHLADDVVNAIRSCYLCAKIVDNFEVVPLSAICEKCVYLSNTSHSRSNLCFFLGFLVIY